MTEPVDPDDFSGQVRIRCDYETYLAFAQFCSAYYSYEDGLRELLRVASDNPRKCRAGCPIETEWDKPSPPQSWG